MPADELERLLDALTAADLDRSGLLLLPADRALLAYADKLTRTPGAMAATDVDLLRQSGFDDRAIHDACAIVGYFAFVNRIADGLGVELETPLP
jgi:alkylhydroperoxidase family enzyme